MEVMLGVIPSQQERRLRGESINANVCLSHFGIIRSRTNDFNSDTLDDRFEPYGHPSKRRAVSPSVPNSPYHHGHHHLHSSNSSTSSPISIPSHIAHSHSTNMAPRSPIGLSISPFQPGSGPSSRSVHSSPILRPVHRLPGREREREERERVKQVNGAGDGVRKINLGR